MLIVRRPTIAWAVCLAMTLLVHPAPVLGDNWGGGQNVNKPGRLCKTDASPNFYNSECTPNGDVHNIYILSGIPSGLASAVRDSIDYYHDLPGVAAYEDSAVDSNTDVIVFYGLQDPQWDIAYTYCPDSAEFGLEDVRYHMWCQPQFIFYQSTNDGVTCWNDPECRSHYACHEVGHTFGLQHPSNISNPDTCMSYSQQHPDALRSHDQGHLEYCYPHPPSPQPTFPTETRTASCKAP
jgi:hypothetical protein